MNTVLRRAGHRDMLVPKESAEQKRIFTWAKMTAPSVPELSLLYAVPNGGSRHKLEAANLKAEGVKAGVPDIHLPVKRKYNSLYIELKRVAFGLTDTGCAQWGTVSEDQLIWLESLRKAGSYAVICRGCEHAKKTIAAYLEGDVDWLEDLNQWWVDMPESKRKTIIKKSKVSARKKRASRTRGRTNG